LLKTQTQYCFSRSFGLLLKTQTQYCFEASEQIETLCTPLRCMQGFFCALMCRKCAALFSTHKGTKKTNFALQN
jgi:hypothetical protein